MRRGTRTAAALTACALASGLTPAAQAQPNAQYVRESQQLLTQTCEWVVDESGAPIRDKDGKLTPKVENGKQVCTVEVAKGAEIREIAAKQNMKQNAEGDEPVWADEKASSELGVGAIIGIVGAVIAAIVGVFFLFIEDIDIRLVPAPAPRR